MTLDSTFLGLIAFATMVMATIQVGAIVFAARAAREAAKTMQELKRDLAPILANARQATDDAARITALALTQVQRVDEFVSTTTARVDETLGTVQDAINSSMRQGSAIMAGLQAALAFFASRQDRKRRSDDDEEDESLFIG